jgi:hypothetical protein
VAIASMKYLLKVLESAVFRRSSILVLVTERKGKYDLRIVPTLETLENESVSFRRVHG